MKHEDEDVDLIDVGDNLQWILDYSSALRYYMDHFGPYEDEFVSNEMFQDCCYSKINQLIQCVNRLSKHHPDVYKDYFEGPMVGVKSMRVWFIHRYERTEPSLVWYFLVNDLPNIENAARDALYRLSFDETKKSTSLNLKPKRSLFGRKNNQK